jgi:myo-inositol catabolism protein IolC
VAQARSGGRDGVPCIVLGRGADEAQVIEWVKIGASVDGFDGFAVGRTLWQDALKDFLAGQLSRPEAVDRIAQRYRDVIDAYRNAEPAGVH